MGLTGHALGRDGTLRVGLNMNNAALIRKDGAAYVGVAYELAQRLADASGLRLVPVEYPNARRVVDAVGSDWDIAFLAIDPARTDRITFSKPYRSVEATFLVRDRFRMLRCSDVLASGEPILSARGAAYHARLEALTTPSDLIVAATPAEALTRFRAGEGAALAGIRNTLSDHEDAAFSVVPDCFARIEQAVALPRQNRAQKAFVDQIVQTFAEPSDR